jgi:hypothetical protein
VHRYRRLPPTRGTSISKGGSRLSVLRFLLGAAVAITVFAHIADAQAQTYKQLDSLLLEFYPDLPSACANARQTLHISVAAGGIAVHPNHETGDGSVVYRRRDGTMTFMLGSTGCRLGTTIGKDIQGPPSGGSDASAATQWTAVPRGPDGQTLTQTHYDASNPACEHADLRLHLQGGVALLHIASQPTDDPNPDRADNGLQGPTGPLRGTIGRRGCEIGLLVFRAD